MKKPAEASPFLRKVRDVIRTRYYSIRTEETDVHWIKRFIPHHGKRHPVEIGELEVAAFLSHLAVHRRVAPATQNQALNALVFLYKADLERPLGDCTGIVCAKGRQHHPDVTMVVFLAAKTIFAFTIRLILRQVSDDCKLLILQCYKLTYYGDFFK